MLFSTSTSSKKPTVFAVPGGKHSFAHSIACASLSDEARIFNIPNILDAWTIVELLDKCFTTVIYNKEQGELLLSEPKQLDLITIESSLLTKSRNLFCLLPCVLHRAQKVIIEGIPQGCNIGDRPDDWYYETLSHFGVIVDRQPERIELSWKTKYAANVTFKYPTMTGTVIAIACAAIVKGTTILNNCSVEPSCEDQLVCAEVLGAKVSGNLPSLSITTEHQPRNVEYTCTPDRVYAVTILSAAILAQRDFTVRSTSPFRIPKFISFMTSIGLYVTDTGSSITVRWPKDKDSLMGTNLDCGSEPKYSSDWAPFALLILFVKSKGASELSDDVFIKRFQFINHFKNNDFKGIETKSILLNGRKAVKVKFYRDGNSSLTGGKSTYCPDIRGTAAILLSTIVSKSPVEIEDSFQLSRGYDNLASTLEKLNFIQIHSGY